jgi:polysaccharide deacetylase family protein (PEP-CTERM system associated)
VYNLSPAEFREDTERAIRTIEDACGIRPRAYRAPSYSITERSLWALEILAECRFTHDSSIYPIQHDRYGIPGFSRHARKIETPSGSLIEVPIATVQLSSRTVAPVGGGAYLRLLPYRYTAAGIRRLNQSEQRPACIYFHPWELDPEQPRLAQGRLSRLRTYGGLGAMAGKLERLLSEFKFDTLSAVHTPVPATRMEAACS